MAKRSDVAVIAHARKTLGGGLDELRKLLTDEIHDELIWYEVPKSKKAPKKIRKALDQGAKRVFVWGGDGMVQRAVDTLAGTDATLSILPAGTANLFATNLGIPENLAEAVRIGLHGTERELDLGKINGEHFAVMAGAGFDGHLISEADSGAKDRMGKLAYVWTGLRHIQDDPSPTKITVDGNTWFEGEASCVLFGNVSTITGGIKAFDDAKPDDGWLEVGVATSQNAVEWARTLGRMALGRSDRSPFVQITRAKRIEVKFAQPTLYELDGGDRSTVRKLKAKVVPGAIRVRVP
ncbi:YegS/Rv2252/BmrU family lipid kinase [Catenuloplanes nepalensis]|uniref:YegS/Rv2252/BmrU family lipid kinase n=1 Tax=Catenuloplanes nepalensis TaxID=587533 RepID=A0ABT9MJZ8_9ACTN|nr:YegS/Rv2252/BmrU family lipid kinase [Catenuloplanes nepalensis]MDP9791742.1 YegS/Rv2252/BmrU family lipid kinase [Catenuloplanes nepalensis]